MADYIDREKIFSIWRSMPAPASVTSLAAAISQTPAADVVEVTFCKDCRYYPTAKVNEKGFLICPASGMEITETDYCSYGSRMDKEDEQ